MPKLSAVHGAVGLARSRRHAGSLSSATTCSTDDFPALTKEDFPARDSLEIARRSITHQRERRNAADGEEDLPVLTPEDLPARDSLEMVRKTIAHKRELRNAADGDDDLPVLTIEDLPSRDSLETARKSIAHKRERRNAALSAALSVASNTDETNAADNTFGSPLCRMSRRKAPWSHHVPHRDSIDLPRERATRDVVAKRRSSFKQRACTRVRTMVTGVRAALAAAKSARPLHGSKPAQDTSVKGRPNIEVLQHTVRKLA